MSKLNARGQSILDAGARLVAKYGTPNVTRRMVAAECSISEALVSNYMGSTTEAQAKYERRARMLKLALPSKERAAEIGLELRAHGPRDARDTRKRSVREVQAIKRTAARAPKLPPLTSGVKA